MTVHPTMLSREFARRTEVKAYLRFQEQQREARERRERKEDAENETADLVELATMVMASDADIRAFRVEIDNYDAATVRALDENGERLDAVRGEIEDMLEKAYVLPDGRRVFKTEDGLRVFDENGQEVPPEQVDPDEIANHLPRWEGFKQRLERRDALVQERKELIEYQDKLDDAREQLDRGDLTQEEFERIRDGITDDMPDAVRRQFPELAKDEPGMDHPASGHDIELDITDDMVATTTASRSFVPGA